ncbi:MAG: hypothetical protein LBL55_00445 [Propionibacteriaceae bacterium]|nr:hypothetical protein [Propionibacteriaceae bacterium]
MPRPPQTRPLGAALRVAVAALVRDALAVGVEGTLPTNQDYLDSQGIGAGTLQRALDELRSSGALRTVSRGHLGRVVAELDVASAWRLGGLPPIRLVLPPAGPVEVTALQEVLAEALSGLAIPHTVRHLRGGSARLELTLTGRADLSVFSIGVLRAADTPGDLKHRALGVGTYYGPDRIAVVRRVGDPRPPRRIAIDNDSPDHRALTVGEFPRTGDWDYLQVPFPRVPAAVSTGQADAGIWHICPSPVPLDRAGLDLGRLQTETGRAAWRSTSEAVLAAGPARPELAGVLEGLDMSELIGRQAAAIAADSGLLPT